jgi:hypothetical protein
MQELPEAIKHKFFRFLSGQEALYDFEQWIYATSALEEVMDGEDYLNLISLNFSKPGSRHELIQLLEQQIHAGEYETWKLRGLLHQFLSQQGDQAEMLGEFYELYCNGFSFLDQLGLGYGLTLIAIPRGYSSDSWRELPAREKERLLGAILPGALEAARKVLDWLDQGKIVITDQQDELGHYRLLDTTSGVEKAVDWQGVRELLNHPESRPWWKFWP